LLFVVFSQKNLIKLFLPGKQVVKHIVLSLC